MEVVDVPGPAKAKSISPRAELHVVCKDSDSKLIFYTEQEKLKNSKRLANHEAKEEVEETSSEIDSESESSDEETKVFDREEFLSEAQSRLLWASGVTLQDTAPSGIQNLEGHGIAFHFADGWDAGVIKRMVDPMKHRERFNVDVFYPGKGGTVYHRLQLELYGTGDDDGAPLGSWALLSPAGVSMPILPATQIRNCKKRKVE